VQRSRRGLATWITSSQTPIFVLDQRNMVLVFNRGCEELTGWQAAEVIGKTCEYASDLPHHEVACITAALCPPAVVFEGEPTFVNSAIQSRSGEIIPRGIHYYPLLSEDSNQRVLGVILPYEMIPSQAPVRQRHFELASTLAEWRQKYETTQIAARSTPMKRVLTQVQLASHCDAAVHVVGERGTGRQHIARTIHHQSDRKKQRFIQLNCQAGSYQEIATTLGQVLNAQAERFAGTVFLGEVDHLPRDLQNLILEHFETSGVRWISSTVRPLDELDEKAMSEDFRCRLTPVVIDVPPLRDRLEDVPLLAQQILEECNRQGNKRIEGLDSEAEQQLQAYDWPGHVGELERFLHAAWSKSEGPLLMSEDLPFEFRAGVDARSSVSTQQDISLDEQLIQYEKSLIEAALVAAHGNKAHAAKLLKIPRPKLYRRLETLGISDMQPHTDSD